MTGSDVTQEESIDTQSVAQDLVNTRRRIMERVEDLKELQEALDNAVKTQREAVLRAEEELERAREGHPLWERVNRVQNEIMQLRGHDEAQVAVLRKSWMSPEKTISVRGGKVTRSTRKGVEVRDTRVAAESLLKRELWAYVKDLKVDVAGVRPLLDVLPGVPGVVVADKYSVSVKLEEQE